MQRECEASRIRWHVSLILRRDKPQLNSWTAHNLLFRMSKLIPEQFCIFIGFVERAHGDGGLVVHLGGEKKNVSIVEVLRQVGEPKSPPAFVFLAVDDGVAEEQVESIADEAAENLLIVWSSAKRTREIAAIGCELSRWWGLKSLLRESVDSLYLAAALENLVGAVNRIEGHGPPLRVRNFMRRAEIAWSNGDVLVTGVDFETLQTHEREERVGDTLKRLADASFSPRAHHLAPTQNLICTQALFWFSELSPTLIDFDWFSLTRLADELYGPIDNALRSTTDLRGRQTSNDAARGFIEQFVVVPGGEYAIGSSERADMSEPPAYKTVAGVAPFRILRRPLLGSDWRLFAHTDLNPASVDALPLVWCTAFDAFAFADLVTHELRRHGLITDAEAVALPTEQQWEAAARGPGVREYPWGNAFEEGCCNCDLKFGRTTTEPGRFSPAGDSPYGCQDMAGNVREWTRSYAGVAGFDWQDYTLVPIDVTASTLRSTDRLVIRGGSYSYHPDCVRAWVRNTQVANRADRQTGFRLVIQSDLK